MPTEIKMYRDDARGQLHATREEAEQVEQLASLTAELTRHCCASEDNINRTLETLFDRYHVILVLKTGVKP